MVGILIFMSRIELSMPFFMLGAWNIRQAMNMIYVFFALKMRWQKFPRDGRNFSPTAVAIVALFKCSVTVCASLIHCVKQPLKLDKIEILMTNGCLMKVESIAECCNFFHLH